MPLWATKIEVMERMLDLQNLIQNNAVDIVGLQAELEELKASLEEEPAPTPTPEPAPEPEPVPPIYISSPGYANFVSDIPAPIQLSDVNSMIDAAADGNVHIQMEGKQLFASSRALVVGDHTIIEVAGDTRGSELSLGGMLRVNGTNIRISNFNVGCPVVSEVHDALRSRGGNHLWFDHCTFGESGDEAVDLSGGYNGEPYPENVSFTRCRFEQRPTRATTNTKTFLVASSQNNDGVSSSVTHVSTYACYFVGNQRNPFISDGALFHAWNCVFRFGLYGVGVRRNGKARLDNCIFDGEVRSTSEAHQPNSHRVWGEVMGDEVVAAGTMYGNLYVNGAPSAGSHRAAQFPALPYSYSSVEATAGLQAVIEREAGVIL